MWWKTFISLVVLAWCSSSVDADTSLHESVRSAWKKRAAAVPSGVVEWTYEPTVFSRFESYWVPANDAANYAFTGRAVFDSERFQYASRSTSYPSLGKNRFTASDERKAFRTHLFLHFNDPTCDRMDLLDYTIDISGERVKHLWSYPVKRDADYDRCIQLDGSSVTDPRELARAVAFANDSHDAGGGVPGSVIHQWNTIPLLLTRDPDFLARHCDIRLSEFELSRQTSALGVESVRAVYPITAKSNNEQAGELVWELTLDPNQDYAVTRLVVRDEKMDLVQIDVMNRLHGEQWIPESWIVQILASRNYSRLGSGSVRQFTQARVSQTWINDAEAVRQRWVDVDATVPSRWICDYVGGTEMVILPDGQRWDIPEAKRGDFSFQQIVDEVHGEAAGLQSLPSSRWTQRRVWATLTRWPGIIAPLTLLAVGMVAIHWWLGSVRRKDSRSQEGLSKAVSRSDDTTPSGEQHV